MSSCMNDSHPLRSGESVLSLHLEIDNYSHVINVQITSVTFRHLKIDPEESEEQCRLCLQSIIEYGQPVSKKRIAYTSEPKQG